MYHSMRRILMAVFLAMLADWASSSSSKELCSDQYFNLDCDTEAPNYVIKIDRAVFSASSSAACPTEFPDDNSNPACAAKQFEAVKRLQYMCDSHVRCEVSPFALIDGNECPRRHLNFSFSCFPPSVTVPRAQDPIISSNDHKRDATPNKKPGPSPVVVVGGGGNAKQRSPVYHPDKFDRSKKDDDSKTLQLVIIGLSSSIVFLIFLLVAVIFSCRKYQRKSSKRTLQQQQQQLYSSAENPNCYTNNNNNNNNHNYKGNVSARFNGSDNQSQIYISQSEVMNGLISPGAPSINHFSPQPPYNHLGELYAPYATVGAKCYNDELVYKQHQQQQLQLQNCKMMEAVSPQISFYPLPGDRSSSGLGTSSHSPTLSFERPLKPVDPMVLMMPYQHQAGSNMEESSESGRSTGNYPPFPAAISMLPRQQQPCDFMEASQRANLLIKCPQTSSRSIESLSVLDPPDCFKSSGALNIIKEAGIELYPTESMLDDDQTNMNVPSLGPLRLNMESMLMNQTLLYRAAANNSKVTENHHPRY